MKHLTRGLAIVAAALLSFGAFAQSKTNIFVASGPTTGVYYPLGGGLADVLTKYIPNLNATAGTTDGSMANLLLIGQSKADVAFSMADASWDAYKGQGKFQDKPVNVRALMVLYPNRMHVVTVEGTGISKIADLKGKRVSTGAPNSATQIMAYRVLEAAPVDTTGRQHIKSYLDAFYAAIGSDDAFYRPVVTAKGATAFADAVGTAPVCVNSSVIPVGTPVSEPIVHKIHAPAFIGRSGPRERHASSADPLLLRFQP